MEGPSQSDTQVVLIASIASAVMIAQQVASKAVRDGFFLAEYSVTALPYMMLASAGASLVAALVFGRLMGVFSPRAVVPAMFVLNGFAFFAEAGLAEPTGKALAIVLYVHVGAFGIAVISGFWSVINERFAPGAAKHAVGRIAAGAAAGGVLGGSLTWSFSEVSLQVHLLCFGALNVVCGVLVAQVARSARFEKTAVTRASLFDGLDIIARKNYPRAIAVVVCCGAMLTGLTDYAFKAEVSAVHEKGMLVGFFAVFYSITGVLTFLVQAFGSTLSLRKLGVVLTACAFPATAIVLLPPAIAAPGLLSLALLRGATVIVENSLYRSSYELLYTTMARAQKRLAKVLIDLGCDRLGTALASGLTLLVLGTHGETGRSTVLVIALIVSVAMLLALRPVRREYDDALAKFYRFEGIP